MKALFIGGTGNISTDVSRLALEEGWELTLINRGNRSSDVPGAKQIILDIENEQAVREALEGLTFDVVANFIAFTPHQVERDIRLFSGKTKQYCFISSASAYQRPPCSPIINEGTPLHNPYWAYSRNKAACEDVLMKAYNQTGFPITIIRPSHTFSQRAITVPVHGRKGGWQVLERMRKGKRVLMPGDGNTLWAVMSSRDFAQAFVGLMGNPHAIGQAVQITSEELLSWNQIMQTIAQILGVEYKPCYVPSAMLAKCQRYDLEGALLGDKAYTVIFDNTKLHRLVPTYQEKYRFDQSARLSVDNFLKNPALQTADPEFDQFCDQVVALMEETEEKMKNL